MKRCTLFAVMQASLLLSILSLVISAFALGWNVYRDVILKPRLIVRLKLAWFLDIVNARRCPTVTLSVLNRGPGKICCEFTAIETKKLFLMELIPDFSHPECAKLPALLDPAQTIHLIIFMERFIEQNPVKFGIRDSYGRCHWVPKRDLRNTRKLVQGFGVNADKLTFSTLGPPSDFLTKEPLPKTTLEHHVT